MHSIATHHSLSSGNPARFSGSYIVSPTVAVARKEFEDGQQDYEAAEATFQQYGETISALPHVSMLRLSAAQNYHNNYSLVAVHPTGEAPEDKIRLSNPDFIIRPELHEKENLYGKKYEHTGPYGGNNETGIEVRQSFIQWLDTHIHQWLTFCQLLDQQSKLNEAHPRLTVDRRVISERYLKMDEKCSAAVMDYLVRLMKAWEERLPLWKTLPASVQVQITPRYVEAGRHSEGRLEMGTSDVIELKLANTYGENTTLPIGEFQLASLYPPSYGAGSYKPKCPEVETILDEALASAKKWVALLKPKDYHGNDAKEL